MRPTPVSLSARKILVLLGSAALALAAGFSAKAQGCESQLHGMAVHQGKATVSVAMLKIPAKAWEHFDKARRASETGNSELFHRETELALKAYPSFAEVYILRAASQVLGKQYNTAIADVAQARLLQPAIPWAGIVLTSALTGMRRFDDAVAESDRTQGSDAMRWQWSFERARAEIGRGDATAALHYSERTLAEAPAGCPDTHLLRANAFQLAGRKAEAIEEFQTYLATPGTPPAARAQVERVLASTRRRLEAETGELMAAN